MRIGTTTPRPPCIVVSGHDWISRQDTFKVRTYGDRHRTTSADRSSRAKRPGGRGGGHPHCIYGRYPALSNRRRHKPRLWIACHSARSRPVASRTEPRDRLSGPRYDDYRRSGHHDRDAGQTLAAERQSLPIDLPEPGRRNAGRSRGHGLERPAAVRPWHAARLCNRHRRRRRSRHALQSRWPRGEKRRRLRLLQAVDRLTGHAEQLRR